MDKYHEIQMKILRELLFKPNSRFTDLNVKELTSDHFSYHINNLIESEMVEKNKQGLYSLTTKGKEFANTMDEETSEIEKQPKVAVLVIAMRKIKSNDQIVIQKRLKEPYYGYQGFFSGKVRFGEKIYDAAMREMKEETDLEGDLELRGIFHDIVYSKEGKLLEDKIFHVFFAQNCRGELKERFEGGENRWLDRKKFKNMDKKYYSEDDIYDFAFNNDKFYEEKVYEINEF